MYYTTTTQIRRAGNSQPRRSDSTVNHIKSGGLPVNPKILREIKERIKNGAYHQKRDALIEDLKSDPFLYIYAVKKLHELGAASSENIFPDHELKNLSDDKLSKLFDTSESAISAHRIRKSTSIQALRMQHSIISTVCAAAIAGSAKISPDEAFAAALFRQLGLNLISWNYPEQYKQALRAQKSGNARLEDELERLVGVRPMSVARTLAFEWRLNPAISRALAETTAANRNGTRESGAPLSLAEICEFAETFACANDPDHYPEARAGWKETELNLKRRLGEDILDGVSHRIDTCLSLHDEFTRFKPALIERCEITPIESAGPSNDYINECLKDSCVSVKANFDSVYALITKGAPSLDALKLLIESVVPASGFWRCCVYFFDEEKLVVNPALRIGDKPLARYASLKLHQNHLVIAALDSAVPTITRGLADDGSEVVQACSALGSTKPRGVLYLEAMPDFHEVTGQNLLQNYHLVRAALLDCLGIEQGAGPDWRIKRAVLYSGAE